MTEIQKAYLIGREDAFNGGVGTHLYIELLFDGEIQVFNDALNKVIASQPFLRAKISDSFCFEIREPFSYNIEVLRTQGQADKQMEALRSELSHKKYVKDDFPLFTMKAIEQEGRYRIAVSIDLIIADGMSLYEMIAEINYYIEHPDAEPVDYTQELSEMVEYYHQSKKTKRYEKAKKYYLDHIDSLYEAPKLNYLTNTEKETIYCHKEHTIGKRMYDDLKKKAAENGFSVTDVLLGVYAMVLSRYSQNAEMSINVTAFKRPDGEVYRHVIGDFTTSMLVQSNFDIQKTFQENVKQIKAKLFTALKYQDFEVTQIIKELEKRGRTSLMPIVFTSMLFEEDSLLGEHFEQGYIVSQTPQVYLDCQVKNSGGELIITWDYRKSKFEPEMIERLFQDYCGCLEYFITSKDDLCQYYNSCMIDATSETYKQFNVQTPEVMWKDKKLIDYFCDTVKEYPEKIFAVINQQVYTFKEIYDVAAELADQIKDAKEKVKKEKTRIVFSGSKSLNSLACVVAAQMTGDSFCAVNEYFGTEKSRDVLESIADYIYVENMKITEISTEQRLIDEEESYIIFTSGTTGKPKGIVITEPAALNTVLAIIKMYNITKEDVCVNISNLYFDLSIFDLYASMITGMKIYMVDAYHVNWFVDDKAYKEATIWNSTPALAREFLLQNHFDKLRCVLMSGDFVQKKLVEDLYSTYGEKLSVTALGGATEASIWSNFFDCRNFHEKKCIPYGIPLANQQMYIGKLTGKLADKGVLGEILIGGDGLAAGYLDKKQTEDAFVWNEQLQERVYKTGDLGYLGYDNNIYIVGRVVNEIKHNGYRIDLREIEKYIMKVAGVMNTFVFIDKLENGRTRLICTVVSDEERIDHIIRKELSRQVPHYMVPTNIVVVDSIPLTSNGKVNMREIISMLNGSKKEYTFTDKEKEVINVCKTVIAEENFEEPVQGEDTFFDMGGQSLQVVALKEAIGEHYHKDIPLQELMNNITVSGLSMIIEECKQQKMDTSQELIQLRKGSDSKKNIVFIHAGSGEVNIYLKLSKAIDETYNVYGIRYVSKEERLAMYDYDFRKIADNYCKLLQPFNQVDYLGGWCIGGTIAYEMSLREPDKYKKIFMLNSMAPVIHQSIRMENSFKQEVAFMKKYLTDEMIESCGNCTEKLWETIAMKIDENEEYRQAVISFIPPVLMRLLPNLNGLDGRKLIYFINMFRSSENARYMYQSQEHSKATCYYYHAAEEPVEHYQDWIHYVELFEDYEAAGNHVSMFSEEHIASLSKQFELMLKS